jgi:hypothetical protein
MVSAWPESDQILLVSDVFLFGIMQRIVIRDKVFDAAILWIRWTIDRQQLLTRLEDSGLDLQSAPMFYWSRLADLDPGNTIGVKSMFYLFEQSLPRHDLVGAESAGIACDNMLSIVLVESLLQNTQNVLLLKKKPTLEVAKATVYGEGVTAVLEGGQVGITYLEVAHCRRCQPVEHKHIYNATTDMT